MNRQRRRPQLHWLRPRSCIGTRECPGRCELAAETVLAVQQRRASVSHAARSPCANAASRSSSGYRRHRRSSNAAFSTSTSATCTRYARHAAGSGPWLLGIFACTPLASMHAPLPPCTLAVSISSPLCLTAPPVCCPTDARAYALPQWSAGQAAGEQVSGLVMIQQRQQQQDCRSIILSSSTGCGLGH